MSGCSSLGHSCDRFLISVILIKEKMDRITEVLEFLKTMIHSIDHDTIKMSKNALFNIQTCLQDA